MYIAETVEGRGQLVAFLCRKRIKGTTVLLPAAFRSLHQVLSILLQSAYTAHDTSALLLSLAFAPSVTLQDSNTSLHSLLIQDPVLADVGCWEEMLRFSIDRVFSNFADMCLETQENTEVKAKIRGVVFAQLAAFGRLMQVYERPVQEASALLEACALRYGLFSHHLDYLLVPAIQARFKQPALTTADLLLSEGSEPHQPETPQSDS